MSDRDEKLQQFTALTGAASNQAEFFLENSAWDMEIAMATYYENVEDVEFVGKTNHLTAEESETTSIEETGVFKPNPKRPSKIATINNLTTPNDDEEEREAYYAGGSEHSGQQVLGPPKKRDIVADMLKSVQEHGVEVLEPSASGSGNSNLIFKGTGYKLGQDDTTSKLVTDQQNPRQAHKVTLRLWQNGFSLNNGPLRDYTDSANSEFLDCIRRGEIPNELKQISTELHLAIEDHRVEAYKVYKVQTKPFQSSGYTLGSTATAVVEAPTDGNEPANEAKAKEVVNMDASKPTTSLQIRLADGSRLVGQFNQEHTISAIRTFIITARPYYQTQPFNLLSTYPSRVLDESLTIKDAGLLNSAIMQKLT